MNPLSLALAATGPSAVGTSVTNTATNSPISADMPFSDLLRSALDSEQQLESQAISTVQGLMSGDGVDVHQAMIATQKANLDFEMTLAVRNKAVGAYQQLMTMQF